MNKDGNQWNNPENKPRDSNVDPEELPEDSEHDIIKGARQDDHLERLKPTDEDEKAPNKTGTPPAGHVDQGDE